MRQMGIIAALAVASVAIATPSQAQERKIQVNIGGGVTFATGQVHDHLGNGGNFDIGIIFNVTPRIGIQAEYAYSPFGKKNVPLPGFPIVTDTVPVDAGHHMHQGTFNVIGKLGHEDAKLRPYVLAGLGVYDRIVQLTSPGVGFVTVCDPWWYVCYPAAVPVTNILGERSSTDMGMDFGGGVTFKLGDAAQFYVEARYHYIWGPKASELAPNGLPPGTEDKNANGSYIPITFGFRF